MTGCRFTITKEIARAIFVIGEKNPFEADKLVGAEARLVFVIGNPNWACYVDGKWRRNLFPSYGLDRKFTTWLKKNYPEFFL